MFNGPRDQHRVGAVEGFLAVGCGRQGVAADEKMSSPTQQRVEIRFNAPETNSRARRQVSYRMRAGAAQLYGWVWPVACGHEGDPTPAAQPQPADGGHASLGMRRCTLQAGLLLGLHASATLG